MRPVEGSDATVSAARVLSTVSMTLTLVACAATAPEQLRGGGACAAIGIASCARLCALDDAVRCTQAGLYHAEGDPTKALHYLRRACRLRHDLACVFLGNFYAEGRGVLKDPRVAHALYGQACQAGEPLGCTWLGRSFESGAAGYKGAGNAHEYYAKACKRGEPSACSGLAVLYLRRGRKIAAKSATSEYERDQRARASKAHFTTARLKAYRACALGQPEACAVLGTLHSEGLGVAPDPKLARAYFAAACEGGVKPACETLGPKP